MGRLLERSETPPAPVTRRIPPRLLSLAPSPPSVRRREMVLIWLGGYAPEDTENMWWGFYGSTKRHSYAWIPKPLTRLCGIFFLFSFSTFFFFSLGVHLHTYSASYLLRLPSVRGRGWPGQSLGASWNKPQRSRLYAALSNRLAPRMPMVAGHMRILVGL